MKKPTKKRKARRWRCQAKVDGKRCKTPAIIESTKFIGQADFQVPLKVKHCIPCGRRLDGMFHKAVGAYL